MEAHMGEAFGHNHSNQNLGSPQVGGNGFLNYPIRNQVDPQIDWQKDPAIKPIRKLLRERM